MAKHLVINKRAEIEDTGVSLESLLNRVVALENNTPQYYESGAGYVRIGDFQVCWGSIGIAKSGNSSTWGTTYWGSGTWTYPQAFKSGSEPSVTVAAIDNISGVFAASIGGTPGASSVPVWFFGSANWSGSGWVKLIAVGWWR